MALEACKANVRKIFEENKETWPEDARKIMGGIVRMRDSGLRRLRQKLDPIDSVAKQIIDDWDAEAASLNETIRAFYKNANNVRKDAYRQIAAWLNAFDRVVWEGDLSLKQMAEAAGEKKEKRKKQYVETGKFGERTPEDRRLEASQKYRHIAGQHQLRDLVKQKHSDRLQNEKAAYSTRTCAECGASVEGGGNLLLVCENGHTRDQDVASAVYFLNQIEGVASITAPPVEIPAHLSLYLRVMRASEVGLEIVEKQ
jgi:ribosomal protein S26